MDMNIGVGIDGGKGSMGVHRHLKARKREGNYPELLPETITSCKTPCKENEGKPECSMPKREEAPLGKIEHKQTRGNFRQRLLKSLEEFKEDIDYRHFNNEKMTREGDELEQSLEEIRGLRKKFRALYSNNRLQDCPYPIQYLSPPNLTCFLLLISPPLGFLSAFSC
ncbi:LOW QUALITY PROTEIN: transcription elongation factor A protein-like 7 [Glossophaga mutica]